ncbi:hypothetical protein EMCRGX_G032027 [Ephydatia muelleri]
MEKEAVDQLLQGMKQLQEEMKIVRQDQEETALRLERSAGRKEPYMSKKRGNELQPGSISKQLVADKVTTAMACVEKVDAKSSLSEEQLGLPRLDLALKEKNEDFYCDICKKGFPLKRNLDRHLKGDKHRTLAQSLSAVVQQLGLESCLQSEEMEEEQAHTCMDIDDGDATATTVDDNDDVDDEAFNMDDVSHDIPVFLRDCVTFLHPQVGLATGIIVQFFLKDLSVDVHAKVDVLLNVTQFKAVVPSSCIYYLPENTLIVYEQIVLSTSAIISLQQKPLDIVRWNPFSAKAAGKKVVMLPLILFADDTSGNKSKKWHKFESWYLLLAGLPRHENAKPENIHFLCSSDRMSALDMTTPIADELIQLENSGVVVYDAYQNEHVLVIAPLLCIICDNPMASQLLNHLGGSANKYCRLCMVRNE